jgi:hypothetical protein
MGGSYPGGGITLGPAMTFGFLIGEQMANTSSSIEEGSAHVDR